MTENEKKLKMEELAEAASFLEAMKDAESKEDLQRIFRENGLDLSKEEIDAFAVISEKELADELGVDELESVAGGVDPLTVLTWAYKGTKAIAKYCWKAGKKFYDWQSKWM